jgi:hypothetical protein
MFIGRLSVQTTALDVCTHALALQLVPSSLRRSPVSRTARYVSIDSTKLATVAVPDELKLIVAYKLLKHATFIGA